MNTDCTIKVQQSEPLGADPKDKMVITTRWDAINMDYRDIKVELIGPSFKPGAFIIVNCQEFMHAANLAYQAINPGNLE